ncbi:MAG: alpha/beta hydrolase [Myxococcaceae bacterium]|nr:alpha/beta hydrolase [Myxococcaceae bacterium]
MHVVAPPLAATVARSLYFRPRRLGLRTAEREVLLQATRFTLEDEGAEVVAHSWGQGPAVALVHGWSGNLGQLTPMVEPLLKAGFRVVGFDWPGHGESEGTASSLLHASRVLQALEQVVGPLHGVVAHSFGAAATIHACSLGLAARRLVFYAPVARLDGYVSAYTEAFRFSERQRSDFLEACARWLHAPFTEFEPLHVATRVDRAALVFHSTDDREVAFDDARRLSTVLGAELRTLEGLGHRRLLRDERSLAETVAFLSR